MAFYTTLACGIVNDINWNHKVAKHSGVETTHRYVLQKAYIIEGRDLIRSGLYEQKNRKISS
jgi:hypothetical protein